MRSLLTCAALGAALWVSGSPSAIAAAPAPEAESAEREPWYYGSEAAPRMDPQTIIRQKAMVRGEQRAQRIAALNWYGMNNSRPTASPTPLLGAYSPVWQMPGGRPFAWRQTSPTIYVIR